MPIGDLLPEITLLLGAVFIVLFAAFTPQRLQGWAAGIALIALALAAGLGVQQWGAPPRRTFSGVWALDDVAIAAKLLILFSGAVVVALSPDWMRSDKRHGEYYALCLFSLLGMIMMASALDAMELVVGVLLSSAASYPLAAYHRGFTPSLEAAMKYFLIGALANLLAFAVVTHLRGRTKLEHYHGLARRQPLVTAALILALLSLVGIPPLVGFFGKFLLFEVTIEAGYAWLAVVAAINTLISLYYYLRVIALTMFKAPQGEVHVLGGWSWVALLVTLLLLILASLGFQWLIERLSQLSFVS